MDRRVEALLDARVLQNLGRLPFSSCTSVSVHVMLAVRTDVVVQADRDEPAALEDPQDDGVCDEPSPFCLKPDEDVRIPHAGNRADVFSNPGGHALRLGPHPARRPHAKARSTATRGNFDRDALGGQHRPHRERDATDRMQGKNRSRRGTGHLYQKDDRWYGQWYVRGRRVKRSLGPVRQPGTSNGLTKRQAQARMLEAMTESGSAPAPVIERLTVEEVGKRRIRELARRGRKQDTTLANYESEIRCHFAPHFGQTSIADIGEDDVAGFVDALPE